MQAVVDFLPQAIAIIVIALLTLGIVRATSARRKMIRRLIEHTYHVEKSLDRIAIALEKSLQKTEGEPRRASEPLKPTDEESKMAVDPLAYLRK